MARNYIVQTAPPKVEDPSMPINEAFVKPRIKAIERDS